jgi:hypothetical protein
MENIDISHKNSPREIDPHTYWLTTTDPKDLELYKKMEAEYKDKPFSQLINLLVEKYPYGLNYQKVD